MNVSLTPQLEKLIKNKVSSGSYHSSSEVIREALRLLDEQDTLRQMKYDQLKKDIAEGLQGESTPLDMEEIILRCQKKYNAQHN